MRTTLSALLLLVVVSAAPARAQDGGLTDLSLEDLLSTEVERVFGASRRLQPVTEAPASVTIVTGEDIQRLGYRSLADILRGVRSLYVTYDRNYSYLGVRGFALPGDYNTRILLLVDGHRMNDNIYDQAGVGSEFGLDPAIFDRVEIIRGPSSSLYGTNAFFAVVNVITRTGASVNGMSTTAEAGSFGARHVRTQAGRRLANGVDLFAAGSFTASAGPDRLYFADFDAPGTNGGVARDLDDEQIAQAFARVGFGDVTVRGAFGRREKGIPTASFGAIFNDANLWTVDARTFVDMQYNRALSSARLDVRAYVDHYAYDGRYPYAALDDSQSVSLYEDSARGSWWGIDAKLSRPLRWRQHVTAGAEYRNNFRQDQGAGYIGIAPEVDVRQQSSTSGAYVEDEFAVNRRLLLSGGLRYDNYSYSGFSKVTPRAAVIVRPGQGTAVKYLYGRAFRAPNAYELDYYFCYLCTAPVGRGQLDAETTESHELVWEMYTSNWLRTSVSGYRNHVNDMIALRVTDEGLYTFVNEGQVNAKGVELEAELRARSGVDTLVSYMLQSATNATGEEAINSPRHVLKGRTIVPGPRPGSSLAVEGQYLSSRRTLNGERVGSAFVANLNATHPLGRSLAILGNLSNAFDSHYSDPGSEEHLQNALEQNGRTFRIGLRWTVGGQTPSGTGQ